MHPKPTAILLLALALLVARVPLHAQTYAWVQRTGGDPVGTYADGATADFVWSWNPGGPAITGHYTSTRAGSGPTFAGSQSAAATILAHRASAPEFDHSPFAVSVGGVNGIFQFVNGGDPQPPAEGVAPGVSTVVTTLTFDGAVSSPANTLIELFDPGSSVNNVDGPFNCTFTATFHGQPVDTSQWTLDVEYPYTSTNGVVTTGITWDGRTVTVPHYLDGAPTGGNFPDTLVFLNTGATTFDTVTATAVGLNVDTFALGFGADTAAVGVVPAGSLQFSSATYNVDEDAGSATVTVRRLGGASGAVAVTYATADGTASDGTDYHAAAGTLSWADGDAADKTFAVPVINPALATGNTVSVTLALGTPTGGAALGPVPRASVNITQTTTPAPPTVLLTSPPDGLTLEAGSPLPLAANTGDPAGLLGSLQFQIDGQPVGPAVPGASAVYDATVPTTPGSHQITVVATDRQNVPYTSTHTLTVVPVNLADPALRLTILTDLDGRDVATGGSFTLDAGSPAAGTGLQRVDFYADGTVFASLDGSATPLPAPPTNPGPHQGSAAGTPGQPARPTRRDAATTTTAATPSGLNTVFQAAFQMPGADKLVNLVTVALDQLGRSTVSKVVSVHGRATTDRAPLVAIAGLATDTHLKIGSTNTVSVSASDPDGSATMGATGARRVDASSDAVLALMEYFINGAKFGRALSPPFQFTFTPPASGKYVLAAVATDGAGLASVSEPVVVVADAAPATVSLGVAGTGIAVEGGARGSVIVTRTGGDVSTPLAVSYKAGGAARRGVDYKALPGTVTIPAGAARAKIKIKPIDGSPDAGTLKVKLTLLPSTDGSYVVGTVFRAKIKIVGK